MHILRTATALLAASLLALGAAGSLAAQQTARAELHDLDGVHVGTVHVQQATHGVLVRAHFHGLPHGRKAFHIHETGLCEPPFLTAGGHFNPHGRQHGFKNPAGHHGGDMPNLHVPPTGHAAVEYLVTGVTLGDGPGSLLAGDGTAFVVHEGPDDYRTDPAGDAGARIACGVVQADQP